MEQAGSAPNSDALKNRQGPKRQPRINLDGPGGDPYQDKREVLMAQNFLAVQPGSVAGNQMNLKSYEAEDQVRYFTPNGDTSFMGQGARPSVQPPVPTLAQFLHPDFDGEKLDSTYKNVGYGSGPAPGDAESLQIPQPATFGMKGGNGRMKGKSLASSGKARGTSFGLGPAGRGPQRNVTA